MSQTSIDREAVRTSEEVTAWCRNPESNRSAGAETILLVEDETFVREVTGEVLRSAGYKVLSARDAVEARRACEAHSGALDLLLTDLILPGETGRALAGRLRREIPEIRVLLMSGYVQQVEQPGAWTEECLTKPFSAGVLLRRVRKVLDSEEVLGGEADVIKHDRSSE